MPTPPANPLRVAECGDCGQLFAVYETSGEVVCPACSSRVALNGLEVAELQIAPAAPIEVPAPKPEPKVEAVAPPAETLPSAPLPSATKSEPERSPTVAEWLMQSETPVTPATPTPPAEEPAPAPSLAESLGWQSGSFEVDTPQAATPTERQPEPALAAPAAAPADEFRFDFGATPLSEQPAATEEGDAARFEASVDDDSQPQVGEYDWTQAGEPERRRWLGPVTAAAGLLAVAGPAIYFVVNSEDPSIAAAGEGRAIRETITQPADETYASDFETPPLPYEPGELPATSEEEASPIVDPATQPASFNQPTPSFGQAERASKPASVAESSEPAAPPADPFNAPLPTPTAEPAPVDRYNEPQSDRYAEAADAAPSTEPPAEAPVEQAAFVPPASQEAPPTIPVETAPYEAPVPRVGLVNTPTYSVEDLNAAIASARPAGEGFASGTLADPQQVQTMGQHYARLCHLAQLLTLFEPDATDTARLTVELEATDVFRRLFRDARPRVESGQIAGPWIGWTGRPHGGVFFTGIPEEVSQQGEVVQYLFRTGETTTAVLVEERLDVNRYITSGAREIGVLGVIVENPREWIAGYEGDAQRVVWARKTLPLPAPRQL